MRQRNSSVCVSPESGWRIWHSETVNYRAERARPWALNEGSLMCLWVTVNVIWVLRSQWIRCSELLWRVFSAFICSPQMGVRHTCVSLHCSKEFEILEGNQKPIHSVPSALKAMYSYAHKSIITVYFDSQWPTTLLADIKSYLRFNYTKLVQKQAFV